MYGNDTLQIVLDILGAVVRFVGMLGFGMGLGWFVLEFLRKGQQAWQLQIAIFLGFVILLIAVAGTLPPAALGGFGIGLALALFVWGMPKKTKEDK